MKKIFLITSLIIFTFCIKSQPYVTATVQISNPQPCTLCCVGSISATPYSSLCPGGPMQIGIQSSPTGTIQWGYQYLSNLCNGIYTVVVSGMLGPPCDAAVICYPYYPITTGVTKNDKENAEEIFFYPNPANGILNISVNSDLENNFESLSIFNSTGQLVREEVLRQSQQPGDKKTIILNINELPNGVYLLQLKKVSLNSAQDDNTGSVSKRFVIAK